MISRNIKNEVASVFILSFCVLLLLLHLGVDFFDLSVPLSDAYTNTDGRMTIAVFKSIIEGTCGFSGIINETRLSAPLALQSFDFPMPMFSVVLYIKFLSFLSKDPVEVFNYFIISTYFLDALVMYFILRRLEINCIISVSIALLFAFIPFHFFRTGHTFYIGYFFIPFWIYLLLKLMQGRLIFSDDSSVNNNFVFSFKNVLLVALLVFSSTWNFYYTFFFSLFLFFLFILFLFEKRIKAFQVSLFIIGLAVILPFLINMFPYKYYQYMEGGNELVAQRNPIESEIYGLKITQLIFPVTYHRIDGWERFKESYNQSTLLFNESQDATLGIIGSFGFLLLIFTVFFRSYFKRFKFFISLAQLNLFAILFSTVGGFGVLFAYFITADIRAYNRISIFIATFSFFSVAIFFQYLAKKYNLSLLKLVFLSFIVVLMSLFDTSPKNHFLGSWPQSKNDFLSDRSFVGNIEKEFDNLKNPMVAQFPYMPYPENGPIVNMKDYEPILGYLHSEKIRWSYGSVKGREADAWWCDLTSRSLVEQVKVLEDAGFNGLLVDKRGYSDDGVAVISELERLLTIKPMKSENGNLFFFKLNAKGNKIDLPIIFKGFYPWEGADGSFRWAGKRPHIMLSCYQESGCFKHMSFVASSLVNREMVFSLNDEEILRLDVGNSDTNVLLNLPLKLGKNILSISSDKSAVVPGGSDSRSLFFSIKNFKVSGMENK